MRKFFFALAVVVLTFAVAAPEFASAASIKVNGIFRHRGVTFDDADRNDRNHDSTARADYLTRMRWTFANKGMSLANAFQFPPIYLQRKAFNTLLMS